MNNDTEKQVELSNTQNNVEENQDNAQSGEHLVERQGIVGTPFTIICTKTNGEKHFITWGKYKVSKEYNTQEEALNSLVEEQYNYITTMFAIMITADKELDELYEKNKHQRMHEINEQDKIQKENEKNYEEYQNRYGNRID